MSNNKTVDEIVSKTAEILGTGKGFGGWTDTVEEDTYKRHVKKQHASREREEKEKEEPLVIHGPDGTRKNPQYSKFIYPKDVIKKESVEHLDEKLATQSLPRQLKDPKSEMLVTSPPTKKHPNGKTFVIYKSEWPKHKESGHTVAEEVEQLDEIPFLAPIAAGIGRKVVGGLAKKAIGGIVGSVFKKTKQPGEEGTAPA